MAKNCFDRLCKLSKYRRCLFSLLIIFRTPYTRPSHVFKIFVADAVMLYLWYIQARYIKGEADSIFLHEPTNISLYNIRGDAVRNKFCLRCKN